MFGKKKPTAGEHEGRKVFRCSFCNASQEEVRKLIAGPNVYICDECADICFRIVESDAEEQVAPVPPSDGLDAVMCCMCRLTTLSAAAVVVPGRGALCSACVTAVVEAVAAGLPQPN